MPFCSATLSKKAVLLCATSFDPMEEPTSRCYHPGRMEDYNVVRKAFPYFLALGQDKQALEVGVIMSQQSTSTSRGTRGQHQKREAIVHFQMWLECL